MELNNDRVLIVAELSANHGGSLETALETVRAAKRAGADAIKLQTYTADTLTLDCNAPDFVVSGTIWEGRTLHGLYQEAHLPWEWHAPIFAEAKKLGIGCFSSPFDATAVDFLEGLGCPMYKIASFEITDIPLIGYAASKGKPIIISTGIAEENDIRMAVDACRAEGNHRIALLKCTSSYPAPIEEANLRMIPDLAARFGAVAGLSDHTIGSTVPVVAVALGARLIEKHFILDRSVGGPDASFSMDEHEFAAMVVAVRQAEQALGRVDYTLTGKQAEARKYCRSLYVAEAIAHGEALTEHNIRSVRPGHGMHPARLPEVLGKRALRALHPGDRLQEADIE